LAWNANLPTNTAALTTAMKCVGFPNWTWTDATEGNESMPLTCMDWYTAFAFCAWDGGRLPTEAEWNYAAAGGAEQRYFPWSAPPTSTAFDSSYAVYAGVISTLPNVGTKSPKGDGRWGQSDLAGNAEEWTLDWYASPYQNPCGGCADIVSGSSRVVRGGSPAFSGTPYLRSSYRYQLTPKTHFPDTGARCARDGS